MWGLSDPQDILDEEITQLKVKKINKKKFFWKVQKNKKTGDFLERKVKA